MGFQLLNAFQGIFIQGPYRHRNATLGDWVAVHLFEDLYDAQRSRSYCTRVDNKERVVNTGNQRRGVAARRGDGTFGELNINSLPIDAPGFQVSRGEIATLEIGVEMKILANAMIKQIDRVISDFRRQVEHFRNKGGTDAICVGIAGINYGRQYVSYEGDREYPTGVKGKPHPIQEAPRAEERLLRGCEDEFDELIVLRFTASNIKPYDFDWLDAGDTEADYGAALVRTSKMYDQRFRR